MVDSAGNLLIHENKKNLKKKNFTAYANLCYVHKGFKNLGGVLNEARRTHYFGMFHIFL